jgi:hypothetical protein
MKCIMDHYEDKHIKCKEFYDRYNACLKARRDRQIESLRERLFK